MMAILQEGMVATAVVVSNLVGSVLLTRPLVHPMSHVWGDLNVNSFCQNLQFSRSLASIM
jgi:hypothetical protein